MKRKSQTVPWHWNSEEDKCIQVFCLFSVGKFALFQCVCAAEFVLMLCDDPASLQNVPLASVLLLSRGNLQKTTTAAYEEWRVDRNVHHRNRIFVLPLKRPLSPHYLRCSFSPPSRSLLQPRYSNHVHDLISMGGEVIAT